MEGGDVPGRQPVFAQHFISSTQFITRKTYERDDCDNNKKEQNQRRESFTWTVSVRCRDARLVAFLIYVFPILRNGKWAQLVTTPKQDFL